MHLLMMLDRLILGYWDGGTKSTLNFQIDGPPQHDVRGAISELAPGEQIIDSTLPWRRR